MGSMPELRCALETLEFARANTACSVYFLDIELGQLQDGIEICRQLHQLDSSAHIVYVSAYQHYALECLRSHAFDFLLKPFTETELYDCLLSALGDLQRQPAVSSLLIRLGSRTLTVDQMAITHFTIVRNQLTAHTAQGTYAWRGSFTELLRELRPGLFLQIHRSCLVNMERIREVDWAEDRLITDSDVALPIARRAKRPLRDALQSKGRVSVIC